MKKLFLLALIGLLFSGATAFAADCCAQQDSCCVKGAECCQS